VTFFHHGQFKTFPNGSHAAGTAKEADWPAFDVSIRPRYLAEPQHGKGGIEGGGESGRLSRIHIPHPIPFITGTFYRHLKRGISAAKRSQCRINNSLPFTLFCKEKSAIIA
jgi:hypothetical protein